MLFSIITVTYNAEKTLPYTLESIKSQTLQDFEYVLIDGASSDETVALVVDAPFPDKRIFSGPDEGLYDAMNRGLQLSRGDYVIFLNAGDSFPSADTLQTYADAIAAAPTKPGMVYGQTVIINADRQPVGERHLRAPEHLTAQSFADGMLVCHQAMAVCRDIAPTYDLRYRFSSDYDWSVRVLKRSKLNVYTGTVTALYLEEGLTTENHRESLRERFKIMKYHYGYLPTVLRHIKFAFRAFMRSQKLKKSH